MEELECARLIEHTALCASARMCTLCMGAVAVLSSIPESTFGPNTCSCLPDAQSTDPEPGVRRSKIPCFSGEACDHIQCMYMAGTAGQNWLLDCPKGKTGFVMIFFPYLFYLNWLSPSIV